MPQVIALQLDSPTSTIHPQTRSDDEHEPGRSASWARACNDGHKPWWQTCPGQPIEEGHKAGTSMRTGFTTPSGNTIMSDAQEARTGSSFCQSSIQLIAEENQLRYALRKVSALVKSYFSLDLEYEASPQAPYEWAVHFSALATSLDEVRLPEMSTQLAFAQRHLIERRSHAKRRLQGARRVCQERLSALAAEQAAHESSGHRSDDLAPAGLDEAFMRLDLVQRQRKSGQHQHLHLPSAPAYHGD